MLDEKKSREYDEYLIDRENRKIKGRLTNEEIAEDKAIAEEKAAVISLLKQINEN